MPARGRGWRTPDLNARPSAQTPRHGKSPVATKTTTAVPRLFGTRDQFCGRQVFPQIGRGWFQMDSSTFIMHFLSTTVTSAPPQIIRHQIPGVGDHCPRSSRSEREEDSHCCAGGSPQTDRRGRPCPESAKRKTGPDLQSSQTPDRKASSSRHNKDRTLAAKHAQSARKPLFVEGRGSRLTLPAPKLDSLPHSSF